MYVIATDRKQGVITEEVSSKTTAKMFMHSDPETAIKQVNEWLSCTDVNIQHICQSQSEKGGRFIFVISVFYTSNT